MYSIIKNITLKILLILGISFQLNAQELNFHNYSTKDGLPQSTIFDIIQDSIGFIWLGTEAGLSRFDGLNFETFNLNDGLVGNNIGALHIDSFGSLWIGTTDGLSIMFEDQIKNFTAKNGLPDGFINGIEEDLDGSIWIATRYGGACRFVGNEIIIYNEETGFPSNQLLGIYRDSKNNIWFSSVDKGMIKFNGRDFLTFTIEDGLQSNKVTSIFEDRNGNLWVGSDIGISLFNGKSFYHFSEREGIPAKEVELVLEDTRGDIWIGFRGSGLFRYDGRKFFKHSGMSSEKIRSGLVDKRGDIWIGTFLGGISRLPIDYFEIIRTNKNVSFNDIYSIEQDNRGKIYFAHFGQGVSSLQNGILETDKLSHNLPSQNVTSVLLDINNTLWLGTSKGVFFQKQGSSNSILNSQIKVEDVLRLFEDSKGYIWIGAIGKVIKYDPISGKIVGEYGSESGFEEKAWINEIYEDNNGIIWFATHHSALITYNGSNFFRMDTSDGLPINNIFSITQDKHGYYWIGTDGKGVCRFDGEKFLSITEENGLSSDVCYFVLEENDELYIGTVDGISILKNDFSAEAKKYNFRYISQSEGIPSKELNQGAYFKDDKGFLWFGTLDGLIKIDPKRFVQNELLPVFLSEINVTDGIHENTFYKSINEELSYTENNISFKFYTITFAKPKNTIYEFKLEGVEENWSKTKENTVTYRALPAGKYVFRVRAVTNISTKGKSTILASFIIAAPFYKTWWFLSSSFILFILIIYSIYFYKTYQVKKRNEALEAVVRERTSALEIEKNKSDELLHNILPSSLVEELKVYGNVRPRRFNSVSIMFTDFKAFTYTTSVLPPEDLVHELNDIFKNFDSLIGKYGLEKLKTIGDSYMAACGIPMEMEDHAIRIVYAALDFQKMIKERNKTSGIKWDMRLGIHSGSVVAGVVGTKKFTYDIWGDTVNIASRMESSGEPGEINISGYTYMLIRDHFECEYRGKVDTKGKGSIDMYFVRDVKRNGISAKNTSFKSFRSFKQIT